MYGSQRAARTAKRTPRRTGCSTVMGRGRRSKSGALVYTWRRKAEVQAAAAPAEVGFVELSCLTAQAATRCHRRQLLWWICLAGAA
jgi:hypothetical protein